MFLHIFCAGRRNRTLSSGFGDQLATLALPAFYTPTRTRTQTLSLKKICSSVKLQEQFLDFVPRNAWIFNLVTGSKTAYYAANCKFPFTSFNSLLITPILAVETSQPLIFLRTQWSWRESNPRPNKCCYSSTTIN